MTDPWGCESLEPVRGILFPLDVWELGQGSGWEAQFGKAEYSTSLVYAVHLCSLDGGLDMF